MYKKGLTLVEIIIICAIVAALSLLFLPYIQGALDSAKETTCDTNRQMLERQITYSTTQGVFLSSVDEIFELLAMEENSQICPLGNEHIFVEQSLVYCTLHGTPYHFYVGKDILDVQYNFNNDSVYVQEKPLTIADGELFQWQGNYYAVMGKTEPLRHLDEIVALVNDYSVKLNPLSYHQKATKALPGDIMEKDNELYVYFDHQPDDENEGVWLLLATKKVYK